jgi:carboxyl-terminal processing protease
MKKILVIFISFIVFSCTTSDELLVPKEIAVQNFIWKGLNLYYLWKEEIPALSENNYKNQHQLNQFLYQYPNPNTLFNNLLYQKNTIDRWSVLFDDYTVLENVLSGTEATTGIDFGLRAKGQNSNEIYGWVRYVLPNTEAAQKGITRGALFYAINQTVLTTSNYRELLTQPIQTLSFADFDNGAITPNGKTVTLQQVPYAENPIHKYSVIEKNGSKTGYLMYNSFYTNFSLELNSVFEYFKSESITDLVLDLRYNSGGSITACTYLAGMITGQFTGEVFSKQRWNPFITHYFTKDEPDALTDFFTDKIETTPLAGLKLTRLYVLTTGSTASASELLINSLQPYISVITIGQTTAGKNVGSITLYDSVDFRKENNNQSHTYAMQPIVVQMVNKNDFGDYTSGILPTLEQSENLEDLGVLGDSNEPFLKTALQHIHGEAVSKSYKTRVNHPHISDRKALHPVKTQMHLETPNIKKTATQSLP